MFSSVEAEMSSKRMEARFHRFVSYSSICRMGPVWIDDVCEKILKFSDVEGVAKGIFA
jgi:hypothetical protein